MYSSLFDASPKHRQSRLTSRTAWTSARCTSSEWMLIDLGSMMNIVGVLIGGRADEWFNQFVTKVSFEFSADGRTFASNPGHALEFIAVQQSVRRNPAPTPVMFRESRARYVRIYTRDWYKSRRKKSESPISMRAAVLVNDLSPTDVQRWWFRETLAAGFQRHAIAF